MNWVHPVEAPIGVPLLLCCLEGSATVPGVTPEDVKYHIGERRLADGRFYKASGGAVQTLILAVCDISLPSIKWLVGGEE